VPAELAVIDTSVYVENVRAGRFVSELVNLPFLVRVSAVVVAELARGARSRPALRFVDQLARHRPLVTPAEGDWVRSGAIVRGFVERHGFEVGKLRDLHFDTLIALTARRIGAHLITCNVRDFRLIREALAFKLIGWDPAERPRQQLSRASGHEASKGHVR
jgi:predicted nucleic acid-binding protein